MTFTVAPYVRSGIEFDQIAVHGIRVTGHHGVLESERETGQVFMADVVVHTSTQWAAYSDDLTKTVNYSDLADRVAEVLAGDPAELIETVAEHIAKAALSFEGVECVDVRVHKPQAPLHVEFKDVTVTIRRDSRTADLGPERRIGSSAGLPDDPQHPDASPLVNDAFDERPLQPVPALLALGGNLGDIESTLRNAVHDLDRIAGIEVRSTSPLVRSRPAGGPDQPDYLNAVIRIHTSLSPRELLSACQGIEVVHGRERSVVNGPRTIDIDVIEFEGAQGESEDLTLPHPRAHERAFVLAPWAAMEPSAMLAGVGRVADAAQALPEGVTVVAQVWPGRATPAAPPAVAPAAPAPETPTE
jgi:dihydroneopterin aldolase/2-amino-4-hydroxy-6-hydroxymethyldihydropteridine diphosphokinase